MSFENRGAGGDSEVGLVWLPAAADIVFWVAAVIAAVTRVGSGSGSALGVAANAHVEPIAWSLCDHQRTIHSALGNRLNRRKLCEMSANAH